MRYAPKKKNNTPVAPPIRIQMKQLPPSAITANSPLYDIQEDDISRSNQILDVLQQAWPRARDIDDVCKLSVTTSKVLESRRKLLNQQLGRDASGSGSGGVLGVYED